MQQPQPQKQGATLQQFLENQNTEFALMMSKYHTQITAPYVSRILALEQQAKQQEQQIKQLQAQKAVEEKTKGSKKGKKDG